MAAVSTNESDESKFEELIQGLISNQFGVVDDFLDQDLIIGLRLNLQKRRNANEMHPAGIGKRFSFQKNLKVRGDQISWIDNASEDSFEKSFVNRISALVDYLNRTCYAGINDFEFHYAFYEEGSFYKRHLDQFQADLGRKFSLVTYLNDNWSDDNGGKLSLYLHDRDISIFPYGARSVFFKSDEVEHEVHPANRSRISIAGWLKRT